MAVLFDIDGTLTNFEKFVLENGSKYMLKKHGLGVANVNGYDIDQVFALQRYFFDEGCEPIKAKEKSDKIMKAFWNMYYLKYLRTPFRAGSAEMIRQLQKEGHQVAFVSSRKHSTENSLLGKFVKASIDWQFRANGLHDQNIILFEDDLYKMMFLYSESHNNHILLDDKPELIYDIAESMDAICIESAYNDHHYLGRNVQRFNNYEDGKIYEAITQHQKVKTLMKNKVRGK